MSTARELVVLGTAAQAPTRERNHNGYLLRWDGEGLLFDPGEGTQRQLLLGGVPSSAITRICLTHFHGDHCLGLPGVLARMGLDQVRHPVDVYFPASGAEQFERLRYAGGGADGVQVRPHPVAGAGDVLTVPGLTLSAAPLEHRIDALGWRLVEPDGVRMLPDRLAARGVSGPEVGRLRRDGELSTAGGQVRLSEVSEPRPGQRFAFLMDTRVCDAAVELASDADLLVCESTYVTADEALATSYRHLTAAQAARIAAAAGARRLVLTHFSQRYPDPSVFAADAAPWFPDVVVARDLMRVPVPARR